MKYEHRWALAERLADRLIMRLDVQEILTHAEVLIPVPLHRKRQRERGFNQAEVIARRLCRQFKIVRGSGRNSRDRSGIDDDPWIHPLCSGLGYQRLFGFMRAPNLTVVRAKRIRPTETQTHLHSRAERAENLRNAFDLVDPAAIEGKHIVLADDVLTTGATLMSLARALKPAGPASLSAIVLAVADPKGRAFEVI
jgi:predicted amidophosphoribosyltransferase